MNRPRRYRHVRVACHCRRAGRRTAGPPRVAEYLVYEASRAHRRADKCVKTVLGEQSVEHLPRLVAEAGEVVALPHPLSAFLPGKRRLTEGDVADEVKRTVVAPHLLLQRGEEHTALLQLADHRLLPAGDAPTAEEVVE